MRCSAPACLYRCRRLSPRAAMPGAAPPLLPTTVATSRGVAYATIVASSPGVNQLPENARALPPTAWSSREGDASADARCTFADARPERCDCGADHLYRIVRRHGKLDAHRSRLVWMLSERRRRREQRHGLRDGVLLPEPASSPLRVDGQAPFNFGSGGDGLRERAGGHDLLFEIKFKAHDLSLTGCPVAPPTPHN